jgi:hypothetical protein
MPYKTRPGKAFGRQLLPLGRQIGWWGLCDVDFLLAQRAAGLRREFCRYVQRSTAS